MPIYDNEELTLLVPSKDVRRFIMDNGYTFTDWQKASILHNWDSPESQERAALHKLRDTTDDIELRRQLTEYLEIEEKAFRTFKDNSGHIFIYLLKYKAMFDDEDTVYFFDYEKAFQYGCAVSVPFAIEKYEVCTDSLPAQDMDDCYERYAVASSSYLAGGRCIDFCSNEIQPALDHVSDTDLYRRFEFMFYEVPNPFDRGDIVKLIQSETYGVVATSQSDWKGCLARFRAPEYKTRCDYSDVQIVVIFPNEEGEFYHEHINPLSLERYYPAGSLYSKENNARDDLLLFVSEISRGNGNVHELPYFASQYRDWKRETDYCDNTK